MESGVASTCFEGSLGFTDMSKRRAQAVRFVEFYHFRLQLLKMSRSF